VPGLKVNRSVLLFSANAVLRTKHSGAGYHYNHTLAHILVEYASAVSSALLPWQCATA